MEGSLWLFPGEITEMIAGHLPEYNRRVLRCVCMDWSQWIKVDKDKLLFRDNLCDELIRNNYGKLLRWFIEDVKFIDIFDLSINTLMSWGNIEGLKLYMTHFDTKINVYDLYNTIEDDEDGIRTLEFLYPIIFESQESRIITFNGLADQREKVIPWLMSQHIITESMLTIITHNGFNFDAKSMLKKWDTAYAIETLSHYFELSPKFIKRILSIIWENKSPSYNHEIVRIIQFTGVWKTRICKEIDKNFHQQYQHICKCNMVIKLKKRKI